VSDGSGLGFLAPTEVGRGAERSEAEWVAPQAKLMKRREEIWSHRLM
jgi:hypothetical protein